MSKLTKRKITVESSNSGSSGNLNSSSNKDSQRRQSVFERLGIKTSTPITVNTALSGQTAATGETYCRHWAQNGTCPYGKSCKFTNTHTLISPSKRVIKKEVESKEQATLRALEEAKRLHSTVIKRSSPDVNWESWDQTDLEYEDEKVLEKRRQLLQRELELQMKREETENSTRKGIRPKHLLRKDTTSSSSSSLTSTSSTETTTSSDDSSSGSSSTSGVKRKKGKGKKLKRDSTSSASDIDRISRKKTRDGKKASTLKKLSGSRRSGDSKKGSTPPIKVRRKASLSRARKKSASPANQRSSSTLRRHPATPPPPPPPGLGFGSKTAKGSSKTGSSSRHAASPRSVSRRSVSVERKEKHNRSLSPRGSNRDRDRERERGRSRSPKLKNRDRSPGLRRSGDSSRSRRKDSPDSKLRDKRLARKNSPKRDRIDDRKKEDDRSRSGKDERRFDRKPIPDRSSAGDREKREHADSDRNRDKAREIAREKERIEALERCRERQREREQMAKEKDKQRDRVRDDRDKDVGKSKDYDRDVPLHNLQGERKGQTVDRDRLIKERKDREKDRLDKERERERPYDRGLDKSIEKPRLGPDRIQDRDRNIDKIERERPIDKDRRGLERERGNERDMLDRNRSDKPPESDRERERGFDRGPERDRMAAVERGFDRDKERVKMLPEQRPRERERPEFERDRPHEKERQFERGNDHERSYERSLEGDRSMEKDRNVVRDRGIERIMERDRGSMDRGRGGSDSERRERERFERDPRYDQRRPIPNEDKGYESPFDGAGRRERGGRYSNEGVCDRGNYSPPREDPRNMRMQPQFGDDRRRRDPGMRNWDYDEGAKSRDWDYPDNRRDWDSRNRMRRPPHPNEPVEECEENIQEKEPIEQAIPPSVDISMKRAREETDGLGPEVKKIRTEEAPPPAILEEDLSDISDDPDEILNRDDIEVTGTEPEAEIDEMDSKSAHISPLTQSSVPQATVSTANNSTLNDSLEQRLADDRAVDEDGVDNLDFEEISDEELEVEARANKGLGDALGVDWASLVAETRPKNEQTDGEPGAARRRWEPIRILSRIGISLKYAGEKMYNEIQEKAVTKTRDDGEEMEVKEPKSELQLLHPVAGIHSTLRLKHSQRRTLFSGVDIFKRALSARRDIAIRRHLCNLPVKSLEAQQAAGLCQWVV